MKYKPGTTAIEVYLHRYANNRDVVKRHIDKSQNIWRKAARKVHIEYLQQVPIQEMVATWNSRGAFQDTRHCVAAIHIESPSVGVMLLDKLVTYTMGQSNGGINQAVLVAAPQHQNVLSLGGDLMAWRTCMTTQKEGKELMLKYNSVYLVIELYWPRRQRISKNGHSR
jgi:hypothetical protein